MNCFKTVKTTLLTLTILLGSIFFPTTALTQAVPVDDTSIKLTTSRVGPEDTHLKVNYNKSTTGVNQSNESYLKFDFSMFPSNLTGSSVQKATLVMYVEETSVKNAGHITICQLGADWSGDSMTGLNAPACKAGIAPISFAVTGSQLDEGSFVVIDITPLVQNWFNGQPNYGIGLMAEAPLSGAGSGVNVEIDSIRDRGNGYPALVQVVLQNQGATGAQGPKGDTGATGAASTVPGPVGPAGPAGQSITGPAGPMGPAGAPGQSVTGPKGDTGATGATGAAGYTPQKNVDYFDGAPGAKGDRGDVGPVGPASTVAGPAGPIGAPGRDGLDSTVAGPTGAAGADGKDGKSIVYRGAFVSTQDYLAGDVVTLAGSSFVALHDNAAGSALLDSTAWSVVAEKGADGLSIVGPKGDAGYTPVKGIDYFDGAAGPTGTTGATGAPGAASTVAGPKGDTGAAGQNGTNGVGFVFRGSFDVGFTYSINDVVSYNGSSYTSREDNNGPTAATPDINPGAWSLVAAAGAKGDTGAQGLPGNGINGTNGTDGLNGAAGAAGRGITSATIDAQGRLVEQFSDSTQYVSASLQGSQGLPGAPGATGSTGPQGPAGLNYTGPGVVATAVTPGGCSQGVAFGSTCQLSATAFDGSAQLTGVSFTWSSLTPNVATVDPTTGVVTGVWNGQAAESANASIVASAVGYPSATTGNMSVTAYRQQSVLNGFSITPTGPVNLGINQVATLTAVPVDQFGSNVYHDVFGNVVVNGFGSANWSTTCCVNLSSQTGNVIQITGAVGGTATVTATLAGYSAQVNSTVTSSPAMTGGWYFLSQSSCGGDYPIITANLNNAVGSSSITVGGTAAPWGRPGSTGNLEAVFINGNTVGTGYYNGTQQDGCTGVGWDGFATSASGTIDPARQVVIGFISAAGANVHISGVLNAAGTQLLGATFTCTGPGSVCANVGGSGASGTATAVKVSGITTFSWTGTMAAGYNSDSGNCNLTYADSTGVVHATSGTCGAGISQTYSYAQIGRYGVWYSGSTLRVTALLNPFGNTPGLYSGGPSNASFSYQTSGSITGTP